MRSLMAAGVCLTGLLAAGPIGAGIPDHTTRVFVSVLNPTSEFSGNVLGTPVIVEADSTVGLGWFYEFRRTRRVGFELGIVLANFDFDESALGITAELGDAFAIPFVFGVDFHLLGKDTNVDLYVGPQLVLTVWGNLKTSAAAGGMESELDTTFGGGAVAGLDVPIGSGDWQFNLAVRYLQMSAEDPSVSIDVDPISLDIGFGYRF